MDRILRDLPKYKPWISASSWESWENFIATTSKLDAVEEIAWELPILVQNACAAELSRNKTPASLSEETARILDKELATPRMVCAGYQWEYSGPL